MKSYVFVSGGTFVYSEIPDFLTQPAAFRLQDPEDCLLRDFERRLPQARGYPPTSPVYSGRQQAASGKRLETFRMGVPILRGKLEQFMQVSGVGE